MRQKARVASSSSIPTSRNFHYSVVKGLKDKHLVGKARTKFATAIASAMFQDKFSTSDEYKHGVQQTFKKWPFLCVRNGDVS